MLGADSTSDEQLRKLSEQRLALWTRITEHLGGEHELATMVLPGFTYRYGAIPQAVRHLLERAYRDGVCEYCAPPAPPPRA
ncbi:hypothetical protein ACWCXB_34890 [Streptomyces sp. NPDC001514]